MELNFDLCWQKIQNGDEAALGEVYMAVFKPLAFYATEITGHYHLAEEVVQDTFIKLWETRSAISIRGSFKAYLFQSVHNHALNALRQQRTRKESVNQPSSDKILEFISNTYDINDNLIDGIIAGETESIINSIIKKLPDQCRIAFCKSRFESLKNDQIAFQMGISEHTVKTHIYRALQKILIALKMEK
jgi:RNA polymerase sigma-70 factor (ECF subfamily)